ncbi:MAG TPA: hypothetical protein VFT49_01040 [Candidatus Saccharimonadales bacterium]|nr:hypothetical protein [Candidatus Saccharimonadales bacterium]
MPPLKKFPESRFARAGSDEARELVDQAHSSGEFTVFEITAMEDYESPPNEQYDPSFLLFVHKEDDLEPVVDTFIAENGFMDAELGHELKIEH